MTYLVATGAFLLACQVLGPAPPLFQLHSGPTVSRSITTYHLLLLGSLRTCRSNRPCMLARKLEDRGYDHTIFLYQPRAFLAREATADILNNKEVRCRHGSIKHHNNSPGTCSGRIIRPGRFVLRNEPGKLGLKNHSNPPFHSWGHMSTIFSKECPIVMRCTKLAP